MSAQNLTVIRSNEIVQSSYSLSLNERRVIELAIGKIKFGTKVPEIVEIHAEEFTQAFGVDIRNAYAQLIDGAEDLYQRSIDILGAVSDDSLTRFRIVTRADYVRNKGFIRLKFTEEIKPYLEVKKESGDYTSYKLLHVKKLNSSHAIRLYELLTRFKSGGWREDRVETLKQLFGVQNNYKAWYDFERYVLRPAKESLNKNSNYIVDYTTKKRGRKIHSVKFTFSVKEKNL